MSILDRCTGPRLLHPIDDLDQRASHKHYSETEKSLRRQLAAAYRLADLHGWSEGIYNHITLRLPAEDDRFLINPFGLLFHEVTASSLITLDHAGNVIDPGSSCFTPNPRGFVLHSAIHQARRDINCVLHMHMPQAIAISCLKDGYQAVCQEGISIGPVSTLGFDGVISEDERQSVVTALGNNHALLLRNHGFLTTGVTVADAFFKAFAFLYNAEAQTRLPSTENLVLPTAFATKRAYDSAKGGLTTPKPQSSVANGHSNDEIVWGPGGLDWEANMRLLDSMGLKTGHQYRLPVWRDEAK